MRHSLPIAPQFYVTAPQTCPYLDGRRERKLFTALQGDHAETLNNSLSKQGFRRSQNVLYRPSCTDCAACLSARIRVADFEPTRSQKRIAKRNAPLVRTPRSAWATEEQYALFRRYLDERHADGGMADMDVFEFAAMIEETPVRTRVIEYRDPAAASAARGDPAAASAARGAPGGGRALARAGGSRASGGLRDTARDGVDPASTAAAHTGAAPLAAVCLTDILDDGLSLVYSFFDPDLRASSLGTHVILDHVAMAREAGLPFVYLGYWVPGSPKMGYKSNFSALEVHIGGTWQAIGDPDSYSNRTHPLSTDPIAQQVAQITLPDLRGDG